MEEKVKKIEDLTKKLLELIGIEATVNAEGDDTGEEEVIEVSIETPEHAGLIIGSKGETLAAIQSFLAISLKNETGDWSRIVLNVGDWRERQEEYLKDLADQAVNRAVETGAPQYLYNLNSAQRRIIHMFLAESGEVETKSEGEGRERYLVITPK